MRNIFIFIAIFVILQAGKAQSNFDNTADRKEYERGYADGINRAEQVSGFDLRIYGCCSGLSVASLAGGLVTYYLVRSDYLDTQEECLFAVPIVTIGAGVAAGSIISMIAVGRGDISNDLMGKSEVYVQGYMDAYKATIKKHRRIVTKSAGIGTSIACVGVTQFILIILTIHNLSF